MGLLKSAFNAIARLHSKPITLKRPGSPALYSPARATPSNYFRYIATLSQTVVTGSEFILPLSTMTGTQAQLISFSAVPSLGTWKLTYNGNSTTDLNFNDVATAVQVALRLVTGLAEVTVTGNYTLGFTVTMYGIQTPLRLVVGDGATPLNATPSVSLTTSVLFDPLLKRGDKLIDGNTQLTVKEIIDMPDLGGEIIGYRARVE